MRRPHSTKSNRHRKAHRVESSGTARKSMHPARGDLPIERWAEVSRGLGSEEGRESGWSEGPKARSTSLAVSLRCHSRSCPRGRDPRPRPRRPPVDSGGRGGRGGTDGPGGRPRMKALNDEPPVGTRVDPLIFELRAWRAKPLRPPAPTAGCEKTACSVVWEGGRAQSRPPDLIEKTPTQVVCVKLCRKD